ncbi:MAG: putative dehydrogenase [Acidimicrobiaceae bacterium]|nr:putative dehydrogenase [Acidimicrobiaceae bacterium]
MGEDHSSPHRLDEATLGRGQNRRVATTQEVVGDLATRIADIVREFGPDAVGFYRGNSATQDHVGKATAVAFAKLLDSKSLYSALTLDAVSKVVVSALMTGSSFEALVPIIDWERAPLVLIVGANPLVSHGHDWSTPNPVVRLRGVKSRGALWVIDPRRTETAKLATRHISVRPGMDYAILAYAVRELLREGADEGYLDRHASGVEGLREAVEPFSLEEASRIAGVPESDLVDLVAVIREKGIVAAKSGTGVTMSATPAVAEWLLWSLQIVTGSFERPGGCWFNSDFFTRLDQQSYPKTTAHPTPGPPSKPEIQGWAGQWPSAAMVDEIENGNLRALIVYAGNPAVSFPDTARVEAALRKLEVLAVADVRSSPTTDVATHVLPALGLLERADLNITTSRFGPLLFGQYAPRVFAPKADRRALWWIFGELGRLLGLNPLPGGLNVDTCSEDDVLAALMTQNARASFDELRAAPSGIAVNEPSYGWVREKVLPDGRWQVCPPELVEQLSQLRTREHDGLVLVPRRQKNHVNTKIPDWNTPQEVRVPDEPLLVINPGDAQSRSVSDGQFVRITSNTGHVRARAHIDPDIRQGTVSLPHGFDETNVNVLMDSSGGVDPLSGMPRLSGIEVEIAPDNEEALLTQ